MSEMSQTAKILVNEAVRLKKESRYDEALTVINLALEHDDSNYDYYNIKALILDNLERFEESLKYYDKSYELSKMNVILKNKARSLYHWASKLHFPENNLEKALDVINQALEISPNEKEYWFLKGEIYEGMGDLIQARKAYYQANDEEDKLNDLENQLNIFEKHSDETLINITGTNFYKGFEPFKEGTVLDLIKEPLNEHDSDAIRVEIDGETVGYVANSEYTLIDGVVSASELTDDSYKAEVLLKYLNDYIIAKIIN